jgi:anti-sigma-K factor RskA
MNCEETRDLLAAYGLDALASDQAAVVERHVEGCQRHDAELRELREGVEAVALAVPERDPPAVLRSRLLAAFESEATASPAPVPLRPAAPARPWRPTPAFAYAAAAVLIVALAGLLAWNIALQTGDGDGGERLVRVFSGEAGAARLLYLEDERAGLLELDLEAQPAERTYQAWAIYGEGPVSLGLVPNEGVAAFRADLGDASAVAISVEPAGGSAQPTSDPVLVATLD